MDLIQQDMFISSNKIKEVEGVKIFFTKEASGGKIFITLEIFARMILFKPYLALSTTYDQNKNTIGVASPEHTMVSQLLKII